MMKPTTKIAAALIAAQVAMAASIGAAGIMGLAHTHAVAACFDAAWNEIPCPPCYEDEPCWDCATMGNRSCGPTQV